MSKSLSPRERIESYLALIGQTLSRKLGAGQDGEVWMSSKGRAIKAFVRQQAFDTELGCYRRLQEKSIRRIGKFVIPRIVDYSMDLMVIEMEHVRPPYLIDFGKAYLDQKPDYPLEQAADREAHLEGLFGEKRWRNEVRPVLSILWAYHGIYYADPKPGNIMFGDEDEGDV